MSGEESTSQHLAKAEVADLQLQRRARNEAQFTAGCGYGKRKVKLLEDFDLIVWPGLEKLGWTKKIGEGKDEGMAMFYPAAKLDSGKSKKYYDKIKDVLDHVLEKRNNDEAKVANAFLAKNADYVKMKKEKESSGSSPSRAIRPRRPASDTTSTSAERRPSVLNQASIDLSWKDGGSFYPKQSSRVGDKYQATDIPKAGSHKSKKEIGSAAYCELIWDPKAKHSTSVADYIDNEVPSNKREACFSLLNERSNSVEIVQQKATTAVTLDGSDWTEDEKKKFAYEVFRLRKDMSKVSKVMKKDMKECLAYYLGTYKNSDDYRLLKTIRVDERNEKASSSVHGVDACAICGDGGVLLVCDGCEGEYHMKCVRPALKIVPEGHWECDECVDKKFLSSRERIIRETGLYEWRPENSRKRKATSLDESSMAIDDDIEANDLVFRPASPVLDTVRAFAIRLSKKLSA